MASAFTLCKGQHRGATFPCNNCSTYKQSYNFLHTNCLLIWFFWIQCMACQMNQMNVQNNNNNNNNLLPIVWQSKNIIRTFEILRCVRWQIALTFDLIWFDLFDLQSPQLVQHSCSARMIWDSNKVIIIIIIIITIGSVGFRPSGNGRRGS